MTSEIKYTPTRAKRRSRDWASRWWLRWASTLRPWLRLLLDELLKETLHAWMVKGTVTSSNFLAAPRKGSRAAQRGPKPQFYLGAQQAPRPQTLPESAPSQVCRCQNDEFDHAAMRLSRRLRFVSTSCR